jgi:hypothetical protein
MNILNRTLIILLLWLPCAAKEVDSGLSSLCDELINDVTKREKRIGIELLQISRNVMIQPSLPPVSFDLLVTATLKWQSYLHLENTIKTLNLIGRLKLDPVNDDMGNYGNIRICISSENRLLMQFDFNLVSSAIRWKQNWFRIKRSEMNDILLVLNQINVDEWSTLRPAN